MERLVVAKNSIFSQLVNESTSLRKNHFRIYPQMPMKQIQHYLNIAIRRKNQIVIQLKPSLHSNHYTEITGKITLSPTNNQIILTPDEKNTTHLIQTRYIHHLRLA